MVTVQHKISMKYIATKNLRNNGIPVVIEIDQAQKFPSRAKAIESLNLWKLDPDEYYIETYYYDSQNGFTRTEKTANKYL